jgi:catechol 2,3-dioxygenase-like lactoylglutathione lyase family enzyme
LIEGVDHFAGNTANRERNVQFYRDVLGLVLTRDDREPFGSHGNLSYAAPGSDRPLLYFKHVAQAGPDGFLHRPTKGLTLAPPTGATDSAFDYCAARYERYAAPVEDRSCLRSARWSAIATLVNGKTGAGRSVMAPAVRSKMNV